MLSIWLGIEWNGIAWKERIYLLRFRLEKRSIHTTPKLKTREAEKPEFDHLFHRSPRPVQIQISSLDLFGQQFKLTSLTSEKKEKTNRKLSSEMFIKRINLLIWKKQIEKASQ